MKVQLLAHPVARNPLVEVLEKRCLLTVSTFALAAASVPMTVSVGPALAGDDASQVALPGDVTQDGKLDGEDVRAMLRAWGVDTAAMAATEQHRLGDLNLDGVVGEDDWSALNAAWRQEHGMILDLAFAQAATAGDYDRSGVVDQLDHGVWKAAFGDKAGAEWPIADGNLDGVVDAADYGVWRDNLGASVAYDTIANAVGAADAEAAREELLDGVTNLAITGAPGKIAVFDPPGAGPGEGAFSVMHDGDYRPIVAASFWGDGRVVAFGHNGYTEFSSVGDQLDTGRLYLNSVRWAAAATGESQAIVTSSTGTRDWLASRGFTNVTAHADWENYLDGADLLITELGPNVSAAKQDAVSGFIEAGGGLITGGTGWGYKSLGYDLQTLDGNQVLRQAGLAWTDGFRNGTTNATRRSTGLANATAALDFAETLWAGSAGTQAQREEAGEALLAALEVLPADHELAVEIAAAFSNRADTIAPTPASPIADSLDKAVVTWASNHLLNTPVDQVSAHSTAAELYGAVPDTAPRVTETVTLDTSKSGWLATGLYVAPGEVVTVTAPASLVGRGYKLRINAHTDDISQRSSWERMPVVHRTFGVETVEVQVASAFGGLLFLDTGSSPAGLGMVDITVSGAVRAPFFVLGQHSDDQWSTTLRNGQAPYGVLVSDNLMIVLPKHQIEQANLTEPTALMTWWNETVAMQDELAAQEEFRTRPEIINVDIQNSAGAAHSGYPIQAYQRHWGNLADWQTLRLEGSWGDFHELGHNHQRGWWTFDGDGEVTVNIFSNYNLEQQASDPLGGWAYSADPVATIQRAMQDVVPGGSYSSKSDRWSFWFQLADGFGWDAYRNVFAGYEADAAASPNRLPVSNEQEKDQWLVRWSNEVGYDMTRFMVDTWGLSVSQAAIDSVSGLPDWMPLATTAADFQIELGQSRTLNLSNAGIGMDGVAEFVGVTVEPRLGTLTAGRNGGHLYEPQVGSGVDSLEVTYRSSAGNTQAFVISIVIGDGKVAGDANQDGTLDMQDVAIFSTNWRGDTRDLDDAGRHASGDFNLDGTINFADWAILYQAWQDQHQQSLSLSTVLQVGADPASVELTASAGNESAAAEFVLPERKWAVAWSSFRSEPDRE